MAISQQQQCLIAQIRFATHSACASGCCGEQANQNGSSNSGGLQIMVFQRQRQQRGIDLVTPQALQQMLSQILMHDQLQLREMALGQRNEATAESKGQASESPQCSAALQRSTRNPGSGQQCVRLGDDLAGAATTSSPIGVSETDLVLRSIRLSRDTPPACGFACSAWAARCDNPRPRARNAHDPQGRPGSAILSRSYGR